MLLLIDNYDSFTWNLVQGFAVADPALDIERDVLVVRNDEITPGAVAALDHGKGPTHIVISPGPGTPSDAGISASIIERFAGKVPILGVCLGHQCLAEMHGLKVERHEIQMHGKASQITHDGQGIFAGLTSPFTAMRYHSLVVKEESIPKPPRLLPSMMPPSEPRGASPRSSPRVAQDGWIISAWTHERTGEGHESNPRRVVMGLRREFADETKFPIEGVQFHPESFLTPDGPRLLRNFLDMAER